MQALGNIFSWLVTALFGAITLLLGYESWALLTNHTPISMIIQPAVHSYPGIAFIAAIVLGMLCLLYTSPSPRDLSTSRMPSSA